MSDIIHPTEGRSTVEVSPTPELPRVETKEAGVSEVLQIPTVESVDTEARESKSPQRAAQGAPLHVAKTELMRRVEQILEDEVGAVYFSMNPAEQERFKKKGEETAQTIEGLIARARATASQLIALLKAWLRLIPGVSTFFLEQEAKIKTDKLIALQQERQKRPEGN